MKYLLVTTTTCIKCPSFKEIVKNKLQFDGEIINEQSLNFSEILQKYNISSAPTIIIFENEKEIFRTTEEFALVEFLRSNNSNKSTN